MGPCRGPDPGPNPGLDAPKNEKKPSGLKSEGFFYGILQTEAVFIFSDIASLVKK